MALLLPFPRLFLLFHLSAMHYSRLVLLPLLCLLAGGLRATSAQPIASAPLPNQLSVLNGRAVFAFPAEAKSSARQGDIMSADRNANLETRIVYDRQQMRLVFFAQELFAVEDKIPLARAVAEESAATKAVAKTLVDNAATFALLSTPTTFDEKADAILINRLLVRTADNTLFQIQAFINPAANKKRAEFTALTERVFRSVQAGTRASGRSAHTEVIALFDGPKKLRIPLPANYGVTVDQKYDFQVVHFHYYGPYGAKAPRTLFLYLGHHPSFLYRDYGFGKEQAQEAAGQVLGQPMRWMTFGDANKGIYVREQQVSGAQVEPGLLLHAGMISDQRGALDEMTQIIAGIELTQ
jgi:hypothetical protein